MNRERGVALVVALVMLLILTVIGIGALVTTSLEGRMTGGTQESNRSFHAAESGVASVLTQPSSQWPSESTPSVTFTAWSSSEGLSASANPLAMTFKERASPGPTNRCDLATCPPDRLNCRSAAGGASSGDVWRYEIDSTGNAGMSAKSQVVQGVCRAGPPSGN